MVNVIITGLPYNLRVHKFIDFLLYHIFEENIKISVNYVCNDGDMAKLSLSMRSNEARKVVRFLDGYEFTSRRLKYPLRCWREDGPSDLNNADDSKSLPIQQSLQSPLDGSDELQAINRQIQLIKKQRILIEEESKLLIEKKRLEMIQSLGPNDFDKLCMLNQNAVVQPSKSPDTLIDTKPPKIPEFIGPCKLILGEMTEIIKSKVEKVYHKIFMNLLRVKIRKRLVLTLKNEAYMSSKEIFAFYRSFYPKDTDEGLIQEVLEEVLRDRINSNQEDTEQLNREALPTDINPSISKPDNGNEEMVFYEDVDPDFEDGFKLDAGPIHNEFGVKTTQNTQTNDECCELNEINDNTNEDYEKSFEYNSKVVNEVSKDGNDGNLSSEKAIESALVEDFDIENDLDDWIEDDRDKENSTEVAKI